MKNVHNRTMHENWFGKINYNNKRYSTLKIYFSSIKVIKTMLTLVSYWKKFHSLPLGKPLLFGEIKNHLAPTSAEGSWDSPHGRTNLPLTFLALGYCLFSSVDTVSSWYVDNALDCCLWKQGYKFKLWNLQVAKSLFESNGMLMQSAVSKKSKKLYLCVKYF